MVNILFVSWDGPQTSYMEGLFMPIFNEIMQRSDIQFHVLQFTWADQQKINEIKDAADTLGVKYTTLPIFKKPLASLGSFYTLFTSSSKIEKYLKENHIDTVMPRSTFPAFMVNKIKNKNFRILFDADGLPIEERVDFAGLKRKSILYKFLKKTETGMLKNADAVITRSQKAIDIHLGNIGEHFRSKFFAVQNGRDTKLFQRNKQFRAEALKSLNLTNEFLFLYAGSLGPQYCLPEMLEVFKTYAAKKTAKFLILTGNTEYAEENIPHEFLGDIIIKKVPSDRVPFYLNAADCAFALRQPTYSMQGVAPIKLGEYLLCGIPVIASKGIGDTEEILKDFDECFLFDHAKSIQSQLPGILEFIENIPHFDQEAISRKARGYFSLEAAADSYLKAIYFLGQNGF